MSSRRRARVPAEHGRRARVGLEQPEQDPDRVDFPAPLGPRKPVHLPWSDGEVEVVKGLDGARS